jgi:uncharacterized Zn finger protein
MWPCLKCGKPTARTLDGISTWRDVSYYRCWTCGHVWSVNREDPENPKIVAVTESEAVPTEPWSPDMPREN